MCRAVSLALLLIITMIIFFLFKRQVKHILTEPKVLILVIIVTIFLEYILGTILGNICLFLGQ